MQLEDDGIMYRKKNKEAKRAVAMAGNQAYDQLY